MVKGLKRAALAVTAASVLALSACGGAGSSGSPGAEGSATGEAGGGTLEVFSWWTSGSEAAALKVLEDAFTTAAPGVSYKNSAVSGGGGSNARTVLSTRLQGGDPPDSWQLHPDLDQANGWEAKLPDTVKNMLQKDGKYYAVPVNAHRANVLWTNPDALKKAGVSLSETTSITDFVAALPKIKDAGVAPVCLGAKDPFAPAQLLEVIIMANVGA